MSSPLDRLTAALADRYRLERELGAGGMATVYLAHDLKHDRKVAIKVLRPELAAVIGAERFLAEIKTTANLQHPHILPLFDSGVADSFLFYVMPFVEGISLRDRMTREKQLPIGEAVRIASEVASALDYAHRHGVIHRDIKPENILLHDGSALVADFGIALAASKAGTRMTETGMSLGTPQYMSPEQAMGERELDARSDVYALGCVTYEMLTGEPPFTGPTAQAIVAKVMTADPANVTSLRKTIPEHVADAVHTALQKLPADRFATAAEFSAALNAAAGAGNITQRTRASTRSRTNSRSWALLAGVALLSLAAAAYAWLRPAPVEASNWLPLALSDSIGTRSNFTELAISPDGKSIVFRDEGQNGVLWLKRQGQLAPAPMPGTERSGSPAFSPNSEWLAFIADGQLKKVRLDGGAAMRLADSASGQQSGIAWLEDETILYASPSGDQIRRVTAAGGAYTTAWSNADFRGFGLLNPTPFPDGHGVFLLSCTSGCATTFLIAVDLRTGKYNTLFQNVVKAWYLPLGRLLYLRSDGVAMVAPFDLDRLQVTGPATPVLDGATVYTMPNGLPLFSWAQSGDMVFLRGSGVSAALELVRVTRAGLATPVDSSWSAAMNSTALAPDGKRLAVGTDQANGGLDVWIKQLDHGVFSRLTFGGRDRRPAWSPDGKVVVFVRDSVNGGLVYGRAADGSGSEKLYLRLDRPIQEVTWSGDGAWLVARTDNGATGAGDLVGVRLTGDTTPVPLAASTFTEMHPAVSPDSRWLAYTSNESGTNEIYVRPFPSTGSSRVQVSNGGGSSPVWSRDGRELFFLGGNGHLISAHLQPGSTIEISQRETLFDANGYFFDPFHQTFSVAPDGRTFLMSRRRQTGRESVGQRAVLVQHWFTDLKLRLAQ